MKLLGTDGSPFVRKARVALAEKGIAYDYVNASPRDPASGVAAANPLSKIPTLLLDDGTAIFDSSVIAEYADGISTTGPQLIPEAFGERIAVRRWAALGDGIVDAAVNIMHDRRLPEPKRQGPDYEVRQMQKIEAALGVIDKTVAAADFVHGARFTLGDAVCGAALGYCDRVLPEFDWRPRYSQVKRYAARLAARPAFVATATLTAEKPPR